MNKPDPQSFAEKISPEQRQQLIEWLADHTYAEACDFVAAPPPDGFGIQVSIATICRFYKANYHSIATVRQEKLNDRGAEQRLYADGHNEYYRENLTHGATLSLQERFYELLSRPVENVDQMKKLVYICKQIQELKIPLDPEKVTKDEVLRDLVGHPLDRLLDQYGTALFTKKEEDLPSHTRNKRRAAQAQSADQNARAPHSQSAHSSSGHPSASPERTGEFIQPSLTSASDAPQQSEAGFDEAA
jgi:hypothetical protein